MTSREIEEALHIRASWDFQSFRDHLATKGLFFLKHTGKPRGSKDTFDLKKKARVFSGRWQVQISPAPASPVVVPPGTLDNTPIPV